MAAQKGAPPKGASTHEVTVAQYQLCLETATTLSQVRDAITTPTPTPTPSPTPYPLPPTPYPLPPTPNKVRPPGGGGGCKWATPSKMRGPSVSAPPRAETTLLELLHQLTKWTSPQLCATRTLTLATIEALTLALALALPLPLPLPLPLFLPLSLPLPLPLTLPLPLPLTLPLARA